MIHASVDLPDPLRPWISTPSPSWTTKSMSRRAVVAQGVPPAYSCPTPSQFEHRRVGVVRGAHRGGRRGAVSTISVLSAAPPFPVRLIDAVGGIGLVVVVA